MKRLLLAAAIVLAMINTSQASLNDGMVGFAHDTPACFRLSDAESLEALLGVPQTPAVKQAIDGYINKVCVVIPKGVKVIYMSHIRNRYKVMVVTKERPIELWTVSTRMDTRL